MCPRSLSSVAFGVGQADAKVTITGNSIEFRPAPGICDGAFPLSFALCAVGVGLANADKRTAVGKNGVRRAASDGQSPRSTIDATGVGHTEGADEDAFASMWSANVFCGAGDDDDAVSGVAEASNDNWEATGTERRDVFCDDDIGLHLFDDAEHLEPQTRTCALQPSASTGRADVLTREAPADHVHGRKVVRADRRHVVVPLRVRPVLGEDFLRIRFAFNLPDDLAHTGALKAKFKTPNA